MVLWAKIMGRNAHSVIISILFWRYFIANLIGLVFIGVGSLIRG